MVFARDPSRRTRLLAKAFDDRGIAEHLRVQHLERQRLVGMDVMNLVDRPHPPMADLVDDAIASAITVPGGRAEVSLTREP
jgi:hypothetical protein